MRINRTDFCSKRVDCESKTGKDDPLVRWKKGTPKRLTSESFKNATIFAILND